MMTVGEMTRLLGGTMEEAAEAELCGRPIRQVAAPDGATAEDVVFAQETAALERGCASAAGAILASVSLRGLIGQDVDLSRVVWVKEARLAFARAALLLQPAREESVIDASAIVAAGAQLGRRVRIGPGVVVETGAVVGDDCDLGPRVVVMTGTRLGARVVVKAGAVLGSAGFGFVRDGGEGDYVPFPQQGGLRIGDDVAIGANATIDRGALGETVIGRGTKIDNLVHIAHNCTVGEDVVIAAQTGVAGSSRIGDGAVIAGQVGIADHVTIGKGVILGAKAGVPSHKDLEGAGQVFWGIPARPIQQYLRELARLRRMV